MTKADTSTLLDQRRLLLTLDQHGRVMHVNGGATNALFGFNPALLINKRLADFVDVFAEWFKKYAEDDSVLALMARVCGTVCCSNKTPGEPCNGVAAVYQPS